MKKELVLSVLLFSIFTCGCNTISKNMKTAETYFKDGNYINAEKYYLQILNEDKNNIDAYEKLCIIYENIDETQDKSAVYCEKAIELNPDGAMAHFHKGLDFLGKNDFQNALTELDTAIKINPKYAEAYTYRAAVKANKFDDVKGAIDDFSQYIKVANKDIEIGYYNRAMMEFDIGMDKEALKDYTKVIEINQQYVMDAYYERMLVNMTMKNFDDVIKDADFLINNSKDSEFVNTAQQLKHNAEMNKQ